MERTLLVEAVYEVLNINSGYSVVRGNMLRKNSSLAHDCHASLLD
jgi:hypothetical protein